MKIESAPSEPSKYSLADVITATMADRSLSQSRRRDIISAANSAARLLNRNTPGNAQTLSLAISASEVKNEQPIETDLPAASRPTDPEIPAFVQSTGLDRARQLVVSDPLRRIAQKPQRALQSHLHRNPPGDRTGGERASVQGTSPGCCT